jgi:glycosyltransferase involved in cell wall biosynthesis
VLARTYDKTFGRLSSPQYDRIFVMSSDDMKHFGKKNTVYVPNGITKNDLVPGDADRFRKKFGLKSRFLLVGVGRLHKTKGFQHLLGLTKKLNFDTQLVIIGNDDGFGKALKAMFRNSARFIGPMPQEKLKDAYAAADIFLLPSDYESFGIVALEAMAQGTPVIATRFGGPKDFLKKDCGILVDPKNAKELLHACSSLLSSSSRRKGMGTAGKKHAKEFLWENIIDTVEEEYLKCIQ